MSLSRTEAKAEAQRLTKLVGREIDIRTKECDCDFWGACPTCSGSGTWFEFFFTFCDHKVEEDDRDGQCYDHYCAEREQARRSEAA